MKSEGKVCSPEWSKKLVEAGIVIETERFWCNFTEKWTLHFSFEGNTQRCLQHENKEKYTIIPAPDVSELLWVLPESIRKRQLTTFRWYGYTSVYYSKRQAELEQRIDFGADQSIPNALASLILHPGVLPEVIKNMEKVKCV